jgi:ABC-type nitrate/sulfonate/bicarbonate transport system ATPase subunit
MAGESQPSTVIEVKGLTKQMPSTQGILDVLDGVDLEVGRGEFLSIIGPSGCGKSTLLNIVAGLDVPSAGDVALDGDTANPRLGRVAYMQQKDLLMPWRSVLENAVLGLEVAGVQRGEARQRAQALVGQFGLSGFEEAYPSALSGGMRQRVAFLRTILAERDVLLLDEPFGALDALTRSQMHEWLLELWAGFGKTIVLVTHDVDEAVFLSDRVYVMTARPGKVKRVLDVDLPRPRTLDLVTDPRFTTVKAELLRAIRDEAPRGQP